jgi:small subunit ribosomal protein S6
MLIILARIVLRAESRRRCTKMAKVSAKYEVMVVFSLKDGEEPMKALVQKFKERIERHAEAVEVNEEWGKRKLAYPIEDETEGYYVIYTFQSTPDYPADLSRRLNLSDGVLRSLVTVID